LKKRLLMILTRPPRAKIAPPPLSPASVTATFFEFPSENVRFWMLSCG
jgi:hypothetical protein